MLQNILRTLRIFKRKCNRLYRFYGLSAHAPCYPCVVVRGNGEFFAIGTTASDYTAHIIVQLYADFTSKETCVEVVRAAIQNISCGPCFNSSAAADARRVAERLVKWSSTNAIMKKYINL